MHPLLDKPHPDCVNEVTSLKECHADTWKKFTGQCNDIKVALDICFRAEKKRVLNEARKDMKIHRQIEEVCTKDAFGHDLTYPEYLQKDREARKNKTKEI
jgi:COX assembly mitochondrial protein 2